MGGEVRLPYENPLHSVIRLFSVYDYATCGVGSVLCHTWTL